MAACPALEVSPDVAKRRRAAIAAAVAAVAGSRARIRRISEVQVPSTEWTRRGRVEIQGSHGLAVSPLGPESGWRKDL
jgi:hypothetical protein